LDDPKSTGCVLNTKTDLLRGQIFWNFSLFFVAICVRHARPPLNCCFAVVTLYK